MLTNVRLLFYYLRF